jgi:hypothetical protein
MMKRRLRVRQAQQARRSSSLSAWRKASGVGGAAYRSVMTGSE